MRNQGGGKKGKAVKGLFLTASGLVAAAPAKVEGRGGTRSYVE